MTPDVAAAEAAFVVASARCRDLLVAMSRMREARRHVGDMLGQRLMNGDATAPAVRVYRRKQLAFQRLDLAHQAALVERRRATRELATARDLAAVAS